ncbi:MAG: murein biosynthesis integral membrane protein MurJ [Proteobacteria bacterium]|nr:murein biosynthesis integral membrane protein MurJ [Desulfobulbaceae bacterium]MBU4151370.1 murein biosynthesis integral membrane protein MurJ [Pseudomonadota bacterium]
MQKASSNTGTIARSAGLVSVAVMCSRVLGLVREQVMAALFGAGKEYDAFVVAFRIPNLLRDLFAEGALSSAFVAVFTDYDSTKGAEETWRLANNVFSGIAVILSLVTLLGMAFSGPLVGLIAPDFVLVVGKAELTRLLTVIMFPFLIFVSMAAVVMGILNSKGRFFIPSLASSFFNVGSIVGGVGLSLLLPRFGHPAIVGMAIGTLLGGFLQLVCQIPALRSTGFTLRPVLDWSDPGLRRVFLLMIPAIIGLGATQINIFVNTNFASSCAEGSVSWLNYAFRLVQFPIGMFGVAVSIAAMPVIARSAALRDLHAVRETYVSALTMGFCLSIPATVGLWVLAEPLIKVIFQHGNFGPVDTIRTAEALSFYVVGLFAYSAVKITVPVFYALNDTKYPVIGSFLAVAANILIITLSIDAMQHKAVALGTSCAMIGNFLFLSLILYRRLSGYSLLYLGRGVFKVCAASAVMWLWLHLAREVLGGRSVPDIAALVFLLVSAVMVYGGTLYGMRLHELTVLVDKVRARVSRQKDEKK